MDSYEELYSIIVEAIKKEDAVKVAFEKLGGSIDDRWDTIHLLRSRS